MVKHTQAIRRQQPTNCLSVFDRFLGLEPKELTVTLNEALHILTQTQSNHKVSLTHPINLHLVTVQ